MGNCATNCSNCMGPNGEHGEYKMADQYEHMKGEQRGGETNFGNASLKDDKDLNRFLETKMKFIVKLQAFWRGHTARRLIGLLRAK